MPWTFASATPDGNNQQVKRLHEIENIDAHGEGLAEKVATHHISPQRAKELAQEYDRERAKLEWFVQHSDDMNPNLYLALCTLFVLSCPLFFQACESYPGYQTQRRKKRPPAWFTRDYDQILISQQERQQEREEQMFRLHEEEPNLQQRTIERRLQQDAAPLQNQENSVKQLQSSMDLKLKAAEQFRALDDMEEARKSMEEYKELNEKLTQLTNEGLG